MIESADTIWLVIYGLVILILGFCMGVSWAFEKAMSIICEDSRKHAEQAKARREAESEAGKGA